MQRTFRFIPLGLFLLFCTFPDSARPNPPSLQSYRDPAAARLKTAIEHADLGAVQRMLESAGAGDCLELDEQGRTALHYAVTQCAAENASASSFQILKLLAARAACVNAADRQGLKPILGLEPLNWANRSKMDTLQVLMASGADLNAQDEAGATLLHQVLQSWDSSAVHLPDLLEALQKAKPNPNLADAGGRTPLHLFFGPLGFCSNRLDDADWKIPVAQKSFSLLAAAGANLALQDRDGTTPIGRMLSLDEPFYGTKQTILQFLDSSLSNQLRIAVAQIEHRPALVFLADRSSADAGLIQRLLALGADARAVESDGFTALHGAAWFFNPEVCQLLLARGAFVNAINALGRTPLHELARSKYLDSSVLEADRAADALRAAEVLLANGADRKIKDREGKTAFDLLRARSETDPDRLEVLRALRKRLKP